MKREEIVEEIEQTKVRFGEPSFRYSTKYALIQGILSGLSLN
jgi:hypothetical protein